VGEDTRTAQGGQLIKALAGKYWKLAMAFMLYMYYYLTAELSFTDIIGASLGEQRATVFYGLYCLIAAGGFFAFGLARRIIRTTGGRRRLFFALGIAGAVCTVITPIMSGWIPGVFSIASMLFAGYIGGALLYHMAVSVSEKNAIGMFIAVPYGAAFLLQYAFGYVLPLFGSAEFIVEHIMLAASLTICVVLLLVFSSEETGGTTPRNSSKESARKYLWAALAACFIISCLYGLLDGIIMNLHTGQQLNVHGWVRLLCIPGLIFAAWISDFRGGQFFSFATLIAMLTAILAVLLFDTAETFNAALGFVYFLGSFMTIYSLAVFVRVARDTDKPGFWASAGRGVKYAAGGVFTLAGSFMFTNMSYITTTVIYVVLLIALACVLYFRGRLSPAPAEIPEPAAPVRTLDEMIAAHGFTEREAETLRLLLADNNTSEIAAAMFVTEGTVYKYISSMIAKTGAKTRIDMMARFSTLKP